MKTRVIIADDHTIVREGLKTYLTEKNVNVIGIAKNGREAIDLAMAHEPDIIMMDISMPDLNGVEATATILKKVPDTKVIALSMHSDKKVIDNMFASGASGYVLKDAEFDDIYDAIIEVKKGNVYLTPSVARMYGYKREHKFPDWESLPMSKEISSKERQVLQLVAEGEKSRTIAQKMGISHKTVESHRRNIMKKLHIFTIAGLTKFAVKEGIASLE